MADIALEAGLNAEDSALNGASRLVTHLWTAAWNHGHGTSAGDAEALHDMRVNLRRLRTVMECFEGSKTSPVLSSHLRLEIRDQRERLESLGDRLGAVRDHDVLAEYVLEYCKKKLKQEIEQVPGLATLERYLQTERAGAFGPMVKKVNKAMEVGGLREDVARWALGLPAASGAPIQLIAVAGLLLPQRLAEIEARAGALQPAADPEELHDLRKSLRRLRYTLECFSVCFAAPVKPFVKTLVELQDLLGEMQDRSVLAETTARCFGDQIPADVMEFNDHGARRRSYLLGKVRRLWGELETQGFWPGLAALTGAEPGNRS